LQRQRDQSHGVRPSQDARPEDPRFHAGAHGRGSEQDGRADGLARAQNAGPGVEVEPPHRPFPDDEQVVVLGRGFLYFFPPVAHADLAAVFHRYLVPTVSVHRDRHDRFRGFRAADRTADLAVRFRDEIVDADANGRAAAIVVVVVVGRAGVSYYA